MSFYVGLIHFSCLFTSIQKIFYTSKDHSWSISWRSHEQLTVEKPWTVDCDFQRLAALLLSSLCHPVFQDRRCQSWPKFGLQTIPKQLRVWPPFTQHSLNFMKELLAIGRSRHTNCNQSVEFYNSVARFAWRCVNGGLFALWNFIANFVISHCVSYPGGTDHRLGCCWGIGSEHKKPTTWEKFLWSIVILMILPCSLFMLRRGSCQYLGIWWQCRHILHLWSDLKALRINSFDRFRSLQCLGFKPKFRNQLLQW